MRDHRNVDPKRSREARALTLQRRAARRAKRAGFVFAPATRRAA